MLRELNLCGFYQIIDFSSSWLILVIGILLIVFLVVIALIFLLVKRKKRLIEKMGKKPTVEKVQTPEIVEKEKNTEKMYQELSSIKEEINELKNSFRELTNNLEKIFAKFPVLAQAITRYPLAPIKDLSEAAQYLNLEEIVIFLDNGLPLDSYPLSVDEKATGVLLEVYRLVEELSGPVKSISFSSQAGTTKIFSIQIKDKRFYVAYKIKSGIEESIADLQISLLRDYVKQKLEELSA